MAQQVALAASEVDGLRKSIAGQVITPSDSTYDSLRRIWNGDIDRRPALIVRCTNQDDVKTALAFARKSGRPIAVRSGGHSVPGHSIVDDGIVIDLREMNQVVVDPSTQERR